MQYKSVGKYIRQKRTKFGIPLNEFAHDSMLEGATLCRMETKPQDIKVCYLAKVAKNFGMTLSEFIKEYEDSPYSKED